MIDVSSLKKDFGTTKAVKGVSFSIRKGSIVGLLGPNGAGKTTIMRIITGYYKPLEGDVQINGISVKQDTLSTRKMIGYLPETSCTYSDMLVCDYLNFIGESRMLSESKKARGIDKSVQATSLQEYFYKPISKLSKGYKQRVGLASALIHDPEILILDEPTSGLDPNQIREIQTLIKNLSKEKTVILSTHILSEVEAVCERAIIINQGKIVLDKPLQEISNLKEGSSTIKVTIKGKNPSAIEKYKQVFKKENESVEQVSSGNTETSLKINGGKDASEKAFQVAVKENYILTELSPEQSSLEEVFTSLTTTREVNGAA